MKKKYNGRLLTERDMMGSSRKLGFLTEFDKLVEVCKVASELYDQENQNKNLHCSVSEKSLGKRPVTTTCRISGEELFKWGFKKSKGESSSSSRYCKNTVLGSWAESTMVLGSCGDLDQPKVLGKKRKCYDSKDEDYECSEKKEEKKKKPRNNGRAKNNFVEASPLPVEFANEIERMGGNDVRLIIQKFITHTDLVQTENRFNIPFNQVREGAKDFLTEAENKTLEKRYPNNSIVPIQVPIIEPNLNRSEIKFKKWPVNGSFWYVLCGSWTVMHENNNLQVGMVIQVWSFRVNGNLNLALVKIP